MVLVSRLFKYLGSLIMLILIISVKRGNIEITLFFLFSGVITLFKEKDLNISMMVLILCKYSQK